MAHDRRLVGLLQVADEGLEDVGRCEETLDVVALGDHVENQWEAGSLERSEHLRDGGTL